MYHRGQIRCFLKIAEFASFTRAAHALHMTPTAVSKQIKNLEEAIGEQLLLRTTRHVSLTEFGALFYERCKLIEEQIHSLDRFIESKKEIPQGELNVLVSTITAKESFLNHLHAFIHAYPDLELNIEFSEHDDDVSREDIDIMVGFPAIPPATEALKYRKLFGVKNILCAAKTFITQYGMPQNAEELPHFKFISHSLRKPAHFLPLANGGQIHCGKPILYMNNFNALNQACLAGIGLFLTGDSLVKPWLDNGELVQILADYEFRHFDIYLFYRAYDYELPKIRVFVDFFTQKLRHA
ncbi:LysR family transcriptional regulator [Legionella oakridgensis]|nr:LysR family transcriptional regulator [Legionella oakridgensis]KTD44544.1 transcriptional regulator [Legionella oakridgensis]STY21045.1 transcriptional regulator [Legionella longbeachae]